MSKKNSNFAPTKTYKKIAVDWHNKHQRHDTSKHTWEDPPQITRTLLQTCTRTVVSLLLSKLPDKSVVYISDTTALDPFVTLPTTKRVTQIVQVISQIVIHSFPRRLIKAILLLQVPITEIVPLAARKEVVFTKVVGRATAPITAPIETAWVQRIPSGGESGHTILEKQFVQRSRSARVWRGSRWRWRRRRRRRRRRYFDAAFDVRVSWAEPCVEFAARAAIVLNAPAVARPHFRYIAGYIHTALCSEVRKNLTP